MKEDTDMTSGKDNARNDRGVAMLYVAVFLMSSLWLVSLAIDMGKLMTTRAELQRAADAAALAGASAVDPANGTLTQALARTRAVAAGGANTALREGSESVVINPDNDIIFPKASEIKVTVHRDAANGNAMTTIFARALGINALDVKADATAKAVPITETCTRLLPFAPALLANGVPYSKDCTSVYTLKADPTMANGGNFQLLSFPACNQGPCAGMSPNGANTIRCLMANGYYCCVDIGNTYTNTKPGNNVGPVKQGLQARWDGDTDRAQNICYSQYRGNYSRVMPVPIVQTFAGLNGRTDAKITGFAGFFMRTPPTGNGNNMIVTGQFIDYVQPGVGGSNPPPNALYTIRLTE